MIAALWGGAGCASPTSVVFRSETPVKVTQLDWSDLKAEGKALGATPVTLPLGQINESVLRLDAPGKVAQYWVVACNARRERLVAKVDLAPAGDTACDEKAAKPAAERTTAAVNKSNRGIMRAYEALISGNYQLAQDVAGELARRDPELAAPFIIIGLARLRAGARQEAEVAFRKAASLDPDDDEVAKLVKMTQF